MRAQVIALVLVALVLVACGLVACGGARTERVEAVETEASTSGGASWSDAQIEAGIATRRDAILACASGVDEVRLELDLSASGELDAVAIGGLEPMATQCARDALRGLDLEGEVESGRSYETRLDARRATEESTLAIEVRAYLDSRRSAILACALEVPATIDARWDGTGAITFHLRGHEATDRERCVRTALESGAPDTAGEPGSLSWGTGS